MAFFRPFLANDPFFSTPAHSLFSPSPSLFFDDDDPFFSTTTTTPLYLYDTPTSHKRGSRRTPAIHRQQQQVKQHQASSADNAQTMVSGAGADSATAAPATASSTGSSLSPANKHTAITSSDNSSTTTTNSTPTSSAVSSLRQPGLLSPLSLLSTFQPATSLLSSRAILPSMSVDVMSTDKEYTVMASVPGVSKADLKVLVDDGVLTIEAERREETRQTSAKEHDEKVQDGQVTAETAAQSTNNNTTTDNTTSNGNSNDNATQPMQTEDDRQQHKPQYQHVESFYGHISRSITLPDDCNTDSMSAKYEDGVLKVMIPRVAEKRQRGTRLEIQ